MKKIEDYSPYELVALATTLGIIVAKKNNLNQQNVIGNFLSQVGQHILTIAAQSATIQGLQVEQCGKDISNDLQKQIDELKKYVERMEDNMNI
ncbi:MAG: hypothetical protein ACREVX_04670 [Clostridium sp.]|uniref:hypothetical protein n=1 Tax=Clostridium sp. TaxID=1506 RepID=UPI003D6D86AC